MQTVFQLYPQNRLFTHRGVSFEQGASPSLCQNRLRVFSHHAWNNPRAYAHPPSSRNLGLRWSKLTNLIFSIPLYTALPREIEDRGSRHSVSKEHAAQQSYLIKVWGGTPLIDHAGNEKQTRQSGIGCSSYKLPACQRLTKITPKKHFFSPFCISWKITESNNHFFLQLIKTNNDQLRFSRLYEDGYNHFNYYLRLKTSLTKFSIPKNSSHIFFKTFLPSTRITDASHCLTNQQRYLYEILLIA